MDVLLNWLWQGAVLALAAAALLRAIPSSRTRARSVTVWAASAAMLAPPAVPLLWFASARVTGLEAPAGSSTAPLVAVPVYWWTSAGAALGLWAIWVLGYAARLGAAAVRLRRAKTAARPFPADVEARLHHWTRLRATGRRAHLTLSERVPIAALLGGRSPIIAVAPALVDRLTDADLDRVVIHEWAHLQRRDDLARMAELCLRLVAGWHPAVWWLGRQLHLEREVACDELTVARTGAAKAYAVCLLALAALPPRRVPLSAVAVVSSSTLHRRVTRILASRPPAPARAWRVAPLGAVAAIGAVALVVGSLRVVELAFASPGSLGAALADRTLPLMPPAPRVARTSRPDARPRVPRTAPARPAPLTTPAAGGHATIQQSPDAVPTAGGDAMLPTRDSAQYLETAAAAIASETLSRELPVVETGPAAIWSAAADAGHAVGAGSEQAAVATAGFFTRFGKKIARSF